MSCPLTPHLLLRCCSITETSFSFSAQDCNKPTHWHYRHPTKAFLQDQGLLSYKQLDSKIYEPPNSYNWHESIFWAPTSHPKPQVGWTSTLTAQGQTRQYQEKLITGLQSKAKETQFWGWLWFPSLYEGPYLGSEENKSDIHCLFDAVVFPPRIFVPRASGRNRIIILAHLFVQIFNH